MSETDGDKFVKFDAAADFLFSRVIATCNRDNPECSRFTDQRTGEEFCVAHEQIVCVEHRRHIPCRPCFREPAHTPYSCDDTDVHAVADYQSS